MKISKNQKEKNRQAIIRAAVDEIIEKGFKSATMRAIAQQAGVADATIYNYFPTKESIILAYYDEHFKDCIQKLQDIPDFSQYTLHEKLNALYEGSLAIYLGDREFVNATFKSIFFSFSQAYQQLQPIRNRFVGAIAQMVDTAVENNEISSQVFQELIVQLFWDHYITMVIYWLGDRSEKFSDTSIMIDKSLDLACAVLSAGIPNKIFDMATFLFKNHVLNRMGFIQQQIKTFHNLKKQFSGDDHECKNSAK